MKRVFTIIIFIIFIILSLFILTACDEVDQVSYDVGKNADNFNIMRRITVYNTRTDKLVFELVGNFSLQNNTHNELEVICKLGENDYRKHFIYLNDNTLYVVEDISGTDLNKYYYEVNYTPEKINKYEIKEDR